MNKIKQTPRFLAMELLVKIREQKTYSNIGLNQVIKQSELSVKDARLLTTLVYGVLQYRLTLEYELKPFIKNARKIDTWVKELLLLAIYQLQYLDKIPKHAIFNETIEIAKVKGHAGTRKFVTGILHAIEREGLSSIDRLNGTKKLSIQYSVPEWIIQQLLNVADEKKVEAILASVNQKPHDSLRVNQVKIDIQTLQNKLLEEGIKTKQSPLAVEGLIAESGHLAGTAAFNAGDFIIQDESAMLVAETMKINPSDQILDACAAPGGKTTQMAAQLGPKGKATALDIHQNKLNLVRQNANKLGVANRVETLALDARKVQTQFNAESFDQVLVDAPCSGIGLMRRKPEIRYEKTLQDSKNLAQIQFDILDAVASLVKVGGKLTYSTCTILPTENQSVVNRFLKRHPEFEQKKTQTENNIKEQRTELGLTIYPDDYQSDGFFIATLVKK